MRRPCSARSRTTWPTFARRASCSAGNRRRRSTRASRGRSRGSRNGGRLTRRRTARSRRRGVQTSSSMGSSSRPARAPSTHVVAVFGPTAAGKTALAGALRERLDGEVVSADAAALFAALPILTAVPDYPARLVGVVPLTADVSVGEYQRLAHEAIDELLAAGRAPIVVGGTGLYLRAALSSLEVPPPLACTPTTGGASSVPSSWPRWGARSRPLRTACGARTRVIRRRSSASTCRRTSWTYASSSARAPWWKRESRRRPGAPGATGCRRPRARSSGSRSSRRCPSSKPRTRSSAPRSGSRGTSASGCAGFRMSLPSTVAGRPASSLMRSSLWIAQGNVYLVVDEDSLSPERVRALVGDADGILEVIRCGDDWLELAIWNPDGSRAEM